jgi:hypothetical protein
MITGVHAIVLTATRRQTGRSVREVLDLGGVDAGGGWLIFVLPPAELGSQAAAG